MLRDPGGNDETGVRGEGDKRDDLLMAEKESRKREGEG
jgi:hypothetical protein